MATLMLLWMSTVGLMASFRQHKGSMWNCETKVDEVHNTALIYQDLKISSFVVPSVWVIISHLHTNMTWTKANNPGKIFLNYLEFNFHWSGCAKFSISLAGSYILTRVWSVNCSVFILMLQILCILYSYVIWFVLDEFQMAPSQLGKLTRKRKAEAKCYKRIMEDPELHNACNERHENSMQELNKKRKVENHRR